MYHKITASQHKKYFGLPKNYRVDACIVYGAYSRRAYQKLFLKNLKKFGTVKIERLSHDFLADILSLNINGKRIWFMVEYGGAKLCEFLHLGSLFGSRANILIGTFGGLQKASSEFSVIVPSASYSTESSAHMYDRAAKNNLFVSNSNLSKNIFRDLRANDIQTITGETVTCQAMLAETWSDVIGWSRRGFLGVEMEAATVFAVSKQLRVPSAAILQIADNLIAKETVDSESYLKKRKKLKKMKIVFFKVAIEQILKK